MLVLASLVVGIALTTATRRGTWSGLRLGAALGLVLGSVLAVVIAGFMGVHGSHYYGAGGSDAGGVPLFGWSTTLPDIRPAHFVVTHLIQALPVAGLVADRALPARAGAIVWTCAALGTALALGLFGLALAGHAPLGLLGRPGITRRSDMIDRARSLASMDRLKRLADDLDATPVIQHDPDRVSRLPAFPASARRAHGRRSSPSCRRRGLEAAAAREDRPSIVEPRSLPHNA